MELTLALVALAVTLLFATVRPHGWPLTLVMSVIALWLSIKVFGV